MGQRPQGNQTCTTDAQPFLLGGERMPLPHDLHRERPPHEELIELIERKFRELNERLDEIERKVERR